MNSRRGLCPSNHTACDNHLGRGALVLRRLGTSAGPLRLCIRRRLLCHLCLPCQARGRGEERPLKLI